MKKAILISGCLLSMVLFMGASSSGGLECPPAGTTNEPVYIPNMEDPHTYYECDNGVAILQECPPELVFDIARNFCTWVWDAIKTASGDDSTEAYCRCKKGGCYAGLPISFRAKCGTSNCNENKEWCAPKN